MLWESEIVWAGDDCLYCHFVTRCTTWGASPGPQRGGGGECKQVEGETNRQQNARFQCGGVHNHLQTDLRGPHTHTHTSTVPASSAILLFLQALDHPLGNRGSSPRGAYRFGGQKRITPGICLARGHQGQRGTRAGPQTGRGGGSRKLPSTPSPDLHSPRGAAGAPAPSTWTWEESSFREASL